MLEQASHHKATWAVIYGTAHRHPMQHTKLFGGFTEANAYYELLNRSNWTSGELSRVMLDDDNHIVQKVRHRAYDVYSTTADQNRPVTAI